MIQAAIVNECNRGTWAVVVCLLALPDPRDPSRPSLHLSRRATVHPETTGRVCYTLRGQSLIDIEGQPSGLL